MKEKSTVKETVYKQARFKAIPYKRWLSNFSHVAAELGVSESALRKYESGTIRVPSDIVSLMAELYAAPELKTWYCSHECMLCRIKYENEHPSPERSLIRAQRGYKQVAEVVDEFSKIIDDGKIDWNEYERLPALREKMEDAMGRFRILLDDLEKAYARGC